jgi:alkylhydroperoxidase family enzyme
MNTYPIHTIDSAPNGSKQPLEMLQKTFGLIPNLAATMGSSPALLNAFVAAFGQFHGTGFSAAERQVLLLSNAVANNSSWPVAFHSTMALKEGAAPQDVEAIRHGSSPSDPRMAALSTITRRLIEARGHLEDSDVKAFVSAGFEEVQLLDVIAGLAVSTLANYASTIIQPPLEQPFQAQEWHNLR